MGAEVRAWLPNTLANGQSGNADLVAYFVLRAYSLVEARGSLGLIATNTVAQGGTREVGLDQLVKDGFVIARAIQSRAWPAVSASLEYAALWGGKHVAEGATRTADGTPVGQISTLLEAQGRVAGHPVRLAENLGQAFEGYKPYGMGFVIDNAEACAWILEDARNQDVLFPYMNGEDLNSRSDSSPSRWIIDFGDRTEQMAKRYGQPFQRLKKTVRPERAKKARAVREAPWWLFLRSRPAMRAAIADLRSVVVLAKVSRTLMPLRVDSACAFSEKVQVFALDSFASQAVLSSSAHQSWAIKHGTTMRTDPTYLISDVFETFPRPYPTDELERLGRSLDEERREIMLRRDLGLTKLYNLVNDPDVADSSDVDVARMRQIHVDLDHAVMAAYGWEDVPLDHGFHTYRQMTRWTVSPAARVEILDRLLEENHRRAALQGGAPPAAEDDSDDTGGDE